MGCTRFVHQWEPGGGVDARETGNCGHIIVIVIITPVLEVGLAPNIPLQNISRKQIQSCCGINLSLLALFSTRTQFSAVIIVCHNRHLQIYSVLRCPGTVRGPTLVRVVSFCKAPHERGTTAAYSVAPG